MNRDNLRQVIHGHMAQIAAQHAAALYPHMDADTAAQLFALLTDTALAYQMEVEAELADPGPGQSLAAASSLSAKDTVLTGLDENLDLKNENPGMAPVNGWLALAGRGRRGSPPAMTSSAPYQRGDRVALVRTDDPDTRLRPGDQGTVIRWDPAQSQLHIRWDCGSTLSMLPGDGDQVRLLAPAEGGEGTGPGDPGDGEPAADLRQDITDPATGLSRLLSERCPTCILRPGDPMHLGPERTAAFIRQVLEVGSYVVCHDTLTYGDFPDYGPGICRGFFDSYRGRSRDLLILQAGRRLTEVPPPLVARAEELGRDAGKAAAGRVFDGSTPKEECQRVLRGIAEGDPAVPGATEPPAIGPGAGYDQDDLARDLGIEPGDHALPRAVSAYAEAFTGAFWQETERAARDHAG